MRHKIGNQLKLAHKSLLLNREKLQSKNVINTIQWLTNFKDHGSNALESRVAVGRVGTCVLQSSKCD